MSQVVIYHANCPDGFTAAWAAWFNYGSNAEYVAANYGEAPPDCTGRDVLIVDFSYPREVLERVHAESKSLVVLDHHKSAKAALEGLPYCQFDMNRSGASMTWDYLFPESLARPPIVNYVEDRDLWRWKLPKSREISAYLDSFKRTFEQWMALSVALGEEFDNCAREGAAILRRINGYVEANKGKAPSVLIGGHLVPCINTTFATSEMVGELASGRDFAAGWFQRHDGKFVYSLRSRGSFDVSEIAKQYGGGGHKNAAGFTTEVML